MSASTSMLPADDYRCWQCERGVYFEVEVWRHENDGTLICGFRYSTDKVECLRNGEWVP